MQIRAAIRPPFARSRLPRSSPRMDTKRHFAACCALLALAGFAQVWAVAHAVVPAQDSIRYLTVAQAIAREGLPATLRSQGEQPLFPALVCLLHAAFSRVGLAAPGNWALSLQTAAAVPLVLAVVPVYLFLVRLVGAAGALVGGTLLCLLHEISRLGADGLSDSTHLGFACLALYATACYFAAMITPSDDSPVDRRPRPAWLAAAGAFTALALMTRAEAIVLPLATAIALLLAHARLARQGAWWPALSGTATAGCCLALGLCVVLLPYLAACDALQPHSAAARLMGRQGATEAVPLNLDSSHALGPAIGEPRWRWDGVRLRFGRKDPAISSRFEGFGATVSQFACKLAEAFQYWVGGLALLGIWWRRRLPVRSLDRFAQLTCLLTAGAVFYVAATSGYLSSRHFLVLVVPGLGWAGLGAVHLAGLVVDVLRRLCALAPENQAAYRRSAWIAALLAAIACLPRTLAPLHTSRLAHREAAHWLAARTEPGDVVLDSRGWTALYSGRTTYRYDAAQAAFSDPHLAYLVVERVEMELDSRRAASLRLLVDLAAEPAACFDAPCGLPSQQVVVHRWRPERFAEIKERLYAR